jgi:hypothetical protein
VQRTSVSMEEVRDFEGELEELRQQVVSQDELVALSCERLSRGVRSNSGRRGTRSHRTEQHRCARR